MDVKAVKHVQGCERGAREEVHEGGGGQRHLHPHQVPPPLGGSACMLQSGNRVSYAGMSRKGFPLLLPFLLAGGCPT